MIKLSNNIIIGIDHGYGNIKTANHIFKAGIVCYDHEPLFTGDMLVYDGRYYIIGEGHKEYINRKETDDDYYILMLAGIAMELESEGLTEADITIAAGLPLTWTSGQKAEFAKYLTRNEEVSFTFRKVEYHIRILGARIYPQGYAAIAELAPSMKGVNVIADIGYGTVNTLISHKSALIEKQAALTEKRDTLRKQQRRTGEKNPEVGEITAELYRIRSELKLCDGIEADIPRIEAIIDEGIKRENGEITRGMDHIVQQR